MFDLELLKVYSKKEFLKLVGFSDRTYERKRVIGDLPLTTQLSDNRVGHRGDHIKQWLDAHVREARS